jgi:hypothetical protein
MIPPKPTPQANGVDGKASTRSSGTDVSVWLDAMDRVVEGQAVEQERLIN